MIKSSLCISLVENVLDLQTLFENSIETVDLRPYNETQKSHQQGRAIVRPCLFWETHKGFAQRKIRGKKYS